LVLCVLKGAASIAATTRKAKRTHIFFDIDLFSCC
jgi:hypothetical protein